MKFVTTIILFIFLPLLLYSQEVIYEEYFTDASLDNPWFAGFNITGSGKILSPVSIPDNPSGDEWVGYMSTWRVADSGGVAQSWSGDIDWSNYSYEANVYIPFTGKQGAMFVDYYALEFRVDTSGNTAAYQFMASFDTLSLIDPVMRFRKRPIENPAVPIILHEWSADSIPGGVPTQAGWHKMTIKAEENQFWFYFNDQEMPGCPFSDTTTTTAHLSNGPIGVYVFKRNFMGDALDTTYIYVDDLKVISIPTSIENDIIAGNPINFHVLQNYPNPFNPTTTIEFVLEKTNAANLTVFDITGKRVRTLVDGILPAGRKMVNWDATDHEGNSVAAGIYFYTLRTQSFSETKRMLLIK
jgi:hypothetical protein